MVILLFRIWKSIWLLSFKDQDMRRYEFTLTTEFVLSIRKGETLRMDDINKLEKRIKDLIRNEHLFMADFKGVERDLVPAKVLCSKAHCWTER